MPDAVDDESFSGTDGEAIEAVIDMNGWISPVL